MKKEYNYPRHGNSQGELTTQQVHADTEPNGHNNLFSQTKNTSMSHTTQNRTMKTKTMSLLALAMFGFLTLFMVGCQKDDDVVVPQSELSLEDVSKVSLQRLAEMQYDQSLHESLYDDVEQRITSLNDQEYDIFLQEWAKVETKRAIELNVVSKDDESSTLDKTLSTLRARNQKSKEEYGKSFNHITEEQQSEVFDLIQKENNSSSVSDETILAQKSLTSCPRYYYGYPTTNNGLGLTSCAGWEFAKNNADPVLDCDFEFKFFPGPIVYSNLKTKGMTVKANKVLNKGGINGRLVSASEFRILVGMKLLLEYPTSGAGGFATDFKFR